MIKTKEIEYISRLFQTGIFYLVSKPTKTSNSEKLNENIYSLIQEMNPVLILNFNDEIRYNKILSEVDQNNYYKYLKSIVDENKPAIDIIQIEIKRLKQLPTYKPTIRQKLMEKLVEIYELVIARVEKMKPNQPIEGDLKLNKLIIKGKTDDLTNDLIKVLTQEKSKGVVYMEESDIRHFVNQNFAGTKTGVNEIKSFSPNMNKSELHHVFYYLYKKYKYHSAPDKKKSTWRELVNSNFSNHIANDDTALHDYDKKNLTIK